MQYECRLETGLTRRQIQLQMPLASVLELGFSPNSYNTTHPTYKALAEVGKAEKTIYVCNYLASRETQREVHEGLSVVENWTRRQARRTGDEQPGTAGDCYIIAAAASELPDACEKSFIERTLAQERLWDRMNAADRRGLTPLFHNSVAYFR